MTKCPTCGSDISMNTVLSRERRADLKARGFCIECALVPVPQGRFVRCIWCRVKRAAAQRDWRERCRQAAREEERADDDYFKYGSRYPGQ